jgi:hypothetical protein
MWFRDALSRSDGTVGGVSKVLAEQLPLLPEDEVPEWIRDTPQGELVEIISKVVSEAYTETMAMETHMRKEREKGRPFEEIYGEVKPYIDFISRPIPKARKLGDSEDGPPLQPPWARQPPWIQETNGFSHLKDSEHREEFDFREPLMLVGDCNDWDLEQARQEHRLRPLKNTSQEDESSAYQESSLRVLLQDDGLFFQIMSFDEEAKWRIYRGDGPKQLRCGVRDHVKPVLAVGEQAEKQAYGRNFGIAGSEVDRYVEIWVQVEATGTIQVWFTECES